MKNKYANTEKDKINQESPKEFNPLCKCKECTGEGLGWIQQLTWIESSERLDRLCAERERYLYDNLRTGGFSDEIRWGDV